MRRADSAVADDGESLKRRSSTFSEQVPPSSFEHLPGSVLPGKPRPRTRRQSRFRSRI